MKHSPVLASGPSSPTPRYHRCEVSCCFGRGCHRVVTVGMDPRCSLMMPRGFVKQRPTVAQAESTSFLQAITVNRSSISRHMCIPSTLTFLSSRKPTMQEITPRWCRSSRTGLRLPSISHVVLNWSPTTVYLSVAHSPIFTIHSSSINNPILPCDAVSFVIYRPACAIVHLTINFDTRVLARVIARC